jgi:hypothetical protein
MDFSKLSQNEKLALYGAIAVFLGGVISNWGGLFWLAVLAAVTVGALLFLPGLALGSKGTVLATLGIVALGAGVIELLRFLEYFFRTLTDFQTIAFIVALVGAAIMAYAGWMELQKEGGKWQFGSATAPAAPPAAPPAEPAAPAAEPPAVESTAAEPEMRSDTVADDAREDERPIG